MAEVNRLADQLRAEAERLVGLEGADKAIERLRTEAGADKSVAFERLNLAVVVALVAGASETGKRIVADELSAATDAQLPLALARHALAIREGSDVVRVVSGRDVAWQGMRADTFEGKLARFALILGCLGRLAPDSLEVAASLNDLGEVHRTRGDLDRALEYHQWSLAIRERLAPDSLDVAASLGNIGIVCAQRGDLDQALEYYQRSLAIRERLAPDSLDVAASLGSIGVVCAQRGDLDQALEYYRRTLAIRERLGPDSLDVAGTLNNIGLVHHERGDLDQALEYHQRSLAIKERLAPESPDVAASLHNIGAVHHERGDLDQALEYYQRSLAIEERLAPESLGVAASLHNIGEVHSQRAALDQALEYYQRSLALREGLAPDSLDVAGSLAGIGNVCAERGALDQALEYYQRSLTIQERVAPNSRDAAESLSSIGDVHRERGALEEALGCYQRRLAIEERLGPDRINCGESYNLLGRTVEAQGQMSRAREWYEKACATLERARERSSIEPGVRSEFGAQYAYMYRNLIRVLLKLGELQTAANTTERMRAQGFRQAVVERGARARATPDQVQRQALLDARRSQLYTELRGLPGGMAEEARQEEITAELARVRLDQDALERETRRSNPEYAALVYPQPMTVEALRAELDPKTVVLSYVVDEEVTWLFAFGPEVAPQAHEIGIAAQELNAKVESALGLLLDRKGAADGAPAALRELGRRLLDPVREVLRRADRVLIVPDGPLWLLPFHALGLGKGACLGDWLPAHYAPSATVFIEGRRLRKAGAAGQGVLALGDPDFSNLEGREGGGYLPIRTAFRAVEGGGVRRGFRLARLPFAGVEVGGIGQCFGRDTEVLRGRLATELSVRQRGPGKRVVHFATHGLLDPLSPLDSAVVLAMPEERTSEDDGFLKAWEVLGLDLHGCDLVTLSACETAKGKLVSGEGIVGLTRAFLYAGAASVLCTQWSVPDDSTAAIMVRFYEHYRAGETKDVALQRAMREIRTGRTKDGSPLQFPEPLKWRPEWSRPYYWAPFILVGEYQQMGPDAG